MKDYNNCCYPEPPCCPPEPCYPPCPVNKEKLELICGRGITTRLTKNNPLSEIAFLEFNAVNLCNPVVKIDFTTVIDSVTLVASEIPLMANIDITFKLIRENQNGQIITLGEWLYRRDINRSGQPTNNVEIGHAQAFSFTYCDKITCKDCYVYKVIASPVFGPEIARLSIINPEINALVKTTVGYY